QCIADGKTEAECKLLLKPAEPKKFVEKSTDELMNMTPVDQMKYMEELAEYRFKIKNINNIRASEAAVKESLQVDRFKSFENMVATLTTKLDEVSTDVKSALAKIAVHDEKLNAQETKFSKFEDEVDDRQVTAVETAQTNLQTIAASSMSFGDFHTKASKEGAQ
ncbi:MAG: hypothetical protein WC365_08180, partial [Candidatus Babeliales bacterium]